MGDSRLLDGATLPASAAGAAPHQSYRRKGLGARRARGDPTPFAPEPLREYDGGDVRRAPLFLGTLLAALALAHGAGSAEQRNWGIVSRPKGFSSIRVVAAPGLSVFLDDKPAGTTDALRQGLVLEDLPAGTYTLRVEKPGFDPKVVKVTVAEGDTKEVRILGLKPKATPTPFPPGWTPPAGFTAAPAPAPAPIRAAIVERKQVPGGTLVVGVASGATDVLPLIEGLKSECACTPALEEMKKRKDGLYEFRVMLPGR